MKYSYFEFEREETQSEMNKRNQKEEKRESNLDILRIDTFYIILFVEIFLSYSYKIKEYSSRYLDG